MKNIKADLVLWARQYSKRLLTALLTTWAIGALIGAVYEFIRLFTSPEMASMDSFYIYLAVPLSCGIPSYVIPNIFLNKEKVKQNYIPDYDSTILCGKPSDIADFGSEEGTGSGLEDFNYDNQ